MFIGEYFHNLDDKGSTAIPSKVKKDLLPGAVVTRGLDNCLVLYPLVEWQELAQKLSRLPISQKNTRAFARLMLAGAWDVKLDTQGRINVPDYLRDYASLKKEAVLAGLFNRIEIWDHSEWHAYKSKTESASDEIAEKLGELGI